MNAPTTRPADKFAHMTDAQLRAHIARLEYLAGTSEETDEYTALEARAMAAREALAARQVTP